MLMELTPELSNHQFTPGNNEVVEEYLRDCIHKSVNFICSTSSPRSIYLQGSFGRGEGTIYFDEDGEPQIWKDLDLILIYNTREDPEKIKKVKDKINKELGFEKNKSTVEGGYISIAQLPKLVAERWKDLKMFELANNSLHIYGDDIRNEMSSKNGKIPLVSGERYLLQKCKGLCKVYKYITEKPLVSNYEVAKTYHEIGNAIALKKGNPIADTEDRLEFLKSEESIPQELLNNIIQYSSYKTEGRFKELENLPAKQSWNEARKDLIELMRSYNPKIGEGHNITENTQKYYFLLRNEFIHNMFASILSSKWPPSLIINTLSYIPTTGYKIYSTINISNRVDSIACSLSASYVAWVLLLYNIDRGTNADLQELNYYLSLTGINAKSQDPRDYVGYVDKGYNRAAKPLYGLS